MPSVRGSSPLSPSPPTPVSYTHLYGPDSPVGRIASVLQGSTETTFYTVAVYFGAVGITKTRYTVPCALASDFAGMIMSAAAVRLLMH